MSDETIDNQGVKSIEQDGEKIVFLDPTQKIAAEKWKRQKGAARNPFSKVCVAKVSTQGPGPE